MKLYSKYFIKTFLVFIAVSVFYFLGDIVLSLYTTKQFLNLTGNYELFLEQNKFLLNNGKIITSLVMTNLILIFVIYKKKNINLRKKILISTMFYNTFFGLFLFLNPYNIMDFNIIEANPKLSNKVNEVINKINNDESYNPLSDIIRLNIEGAKTFSKEELLIINLTEIKNEKNFYTDFIDKETQEINSNYNLNFISKLILPFFYGEIIIIIIIMFTSFIEFSCNKNSEITNYKKVRWISVVNLFYVYLYYVYVSTIIIMNYENYSYIMTLLNLTIINFTSITLYYIYFTHEKTIEKLRSNDVFEKGSIYVFIFLIIMLIQFLHFINNETSIYLIIISGFIIKIFSGVISSNIDKNRDLFFNVVFFLSLFFQIIINLCLKEEYVINKTLLIYAIMIGFFYTDKCLIISTFVRKKFKKMTTEL